MPGERGRLGRDAFHQIAVAHDRIREVIHNGVARTIEVRGEKALGDGHADAVAKTLAERAAGGFDAGRQAVLGMPRRPALPLAEVTQLLEREIVAGQVQQRVEQHRAVPGGEHEAVAVRPRGVARIVAQEARPKHIGHRGGAHRHAGMAGLGSLDRVHGQRADRVDAQLV